jgi:hypothetical protein
MLPMEARQGGTLLERVVPEPVDPSLVMGTWKWLLLPHNKQQGFSSKQICSVEYLFTGLSPAFFMGSTMDPSAA